MACKTSENIQALDKEGRMDSNDTQNARKDRKGSAMNYKSDMSTIPVGKQPVSRRSFIAAAAG